MALSREDYNRMVGLIASGDVPESKLAAAKRAITEYETANNVEDTALEAVNTIAQNMAAGILGLPGDIAALIGKENKYTSEELAVRLGGDPEHGSFLPTQLLAPGPGEFKLLAGLGATGAAIKVGRKKGENFAQAVYGMAGANKKYNKVTPKIAHGKQKIHLYKMAKKVMKDHIFKFADGSEIWDAGQMDDLIDKTVEHVMKNQDDLLKVYDPERAKLSTYTYNIMKNKLRDKQDEMLAELVPTGKGAVDLGKKELRRYRISRLNPRSTNVPSAEAVAGGADVRDPHHFLAGTQTGELGDAGEMTLASGDTVNTTRTGNLAEKRLMEGLHPELSARGQEEARTAFRTWNPPMGSKGSTRVTSAESLPPVNVKPVPVGVRPQIIQLVTDKASRSKPETKAALVDVLVQKANGVPHKDIDWIAIVENRYGYDMPVTRKRDLAKNLRQTANRLTDDARAIAEAAPTEVRGRYSGDLVSGTRKSSADTVVSGTFDNPPAQRAGTGKGVTDRSTGKPEPVISRSESRKISIHTKAEIKRLTKRINSLLAQLRPLDPADRDPALVAMLDSMRRQRSRLRSFAENMPKDPRSKGYPEFTKQNVREGKFKYPKYTKE